MFAVAGLMVGATISAYQNDAKKLTVFCALVAAAAVAAAVVMLIGGVR
ncbi:membrane protein [Corynebacterium frankenforstense DSM 45800]|uniref:Membrane protein n=2 Tax=Corynebacterium TaxID=1716 RepID=A0A1L7CTI0_9CORY|nr:membrane protein [Corynebacterium frankenforstense DSM 45800]